MIPIIKLMINVFSFPIRVYILFYPLLVASQTTPSIISSHSGNFNSFDDKLEKSGLWIEYLNTTISVGTHCGGVKEGVWFTFDEYNELKSLTFYDNSEYKTKISFDTPKQIEFVCLDTNFVRNALNISGFPVDDNWEGYMGENLDNFSFIKQLPEFPELFMEFHASNGISFCISKGYYSPIYISFKIPLNPSNIEYLYVNFRNEGNDPKWNLYEIFKVNNGRIDDYHFIYNPEIGSFPECIVHFDSGYLDGTSYIWTESKEFASVEFKMGKVQDVSRVRKISEFTKYFYISRRRYYLIEHVFYPWERYKLFSGQNEESNELYCGFRGTAGSSRSLERSHK